jgi:hypothetical protein
VLCVSFVVQRTGNMGNMYILSSSDVFYAALCAFVVSLWTVDQVPSLRRYERTMHEKNVRFPIAEVFTRSPRTWIHSGSWLPSCLRVCVVLDGLYMYIVYIYISTILRLRCCWQRTYDIDMCYLQLYMHTYTSNKNWILPAQKEHLTNRTGG